MTQKTLFVVLILGFIGLIILAATMLWPRAETGVALSTSTTDQKADAEPFAGAGKASPAHPTQRNPALSEDSPGTVQGAVRATLPPPIIVTLDAQGTVLDDNHHPIDGASVFILPAPDDQRQHFVDGDPSEWYASGIQLSTDPEGRFPLQVLRPDVAHALIARKKGYGWEFAELDPRHEVTDLTLELKVSATLRGYAVDRDGKPIPEVRVSHRFSYVYDTWKTWSTAHALHSELTWEAVETDSDGRFTFQEVTSEEQDLRAERENLATIEMGPLSPDAELILTMVPSAVVYGQITDTRDDPIPDVFVRTSTYGALPGQMTPWVHSDAKGLYTIDGALSGSVGVVVWTEAGYALDRTNLWVEPGEHTRVDFVLPEEEGIDGVVVDSGDSPLAGTHLIFRSERHGYVAADLHCDENGHFEARGFVPGETYSIWYTGSDEFGPRLVRGVLAGSRDVRVRLLEKSTFWGRLTFDGEPSKEVRVRFLPRRDLPMNDGLMFIRDRVQGSQEVHKLEPSADHYEYRYWPGIYDLEFSADGYAPLLCKNVTLVPGKIPRPLDLHFTFSSRLSGFVVDASSSQPIAGARIEVLEEYYNGGFQQSPLPLATTTDSTGLFTLLVPQRGELVLLASAPSFAPQTLRDVSASIAAPSPMEIRLHRGGRIEGRVDTPYANPSSTLEVTVREIGREDGSSTFVGRDRTYAIDNVPPGRVEVVLTDRYYRAAYPDVESQVRQAVIADGETVRVDFDAATGVTLKGRVEGWDKRLLIEARLLGSEDESLITGASYTDRDGRFRIPHLRPGHYRVGSTAGQPGSSVAVAGELTISTREPDEIVLTVPGNTVKGVVHDIGGTGIARAIITVEPEPSQGLILATCLAGGEGEFAIGGLEDGHYAFKAQARGHATSLAEHHPVPGPDLDITLPPDARLRVIVCDDLGMVLPGAVVAVAHTTQRRLAWRDLTGAEGLVQFVGLQAYPHVVTATLDGYLAPDPLIVPLREGDIRDVTLVLGRAGELLVTISDPDGHALEGVPVLLRAEDRETAAERQTDEEGTVLFKDLAPGWYEVLAGVDQQISDAADVLPGERAELELTVGPSK
ncbi:MAG: carboxypeptidase regulatory-like domain-containing protein [Planctomycetota bacterium]